ncbi:MAG TPA: homoserine dehydrogenase [Candidatus Eisenbacteria bacterium]|jgi:homoserine dehydrogenase
MSGTPIRIGLLGCGVVGSGLLQLLREREAEIEAAIGAPVRVSRLAVADPSKQRGVDLTGIAVGTDALDVAGASDIDVLVELIGGADRALPPVRRALERGVAVVTANKHLLSAHADALDAARAASGAALRCEAAVGGAIPVLQALDHGLLTERFTLLVAILNGTTNFILSTMEREGRDFAEALDAAQKLGFAEADPSLDLSGADTAQKLAILVRRAFGVSLPHDAIPTEGILGMQLEDLRQADRFGYAVKLLGVAMRTPDGLDLRVHPAFIPRRYLLASVRDEFNGVYLRGEATGNMMFYGKGAGARPTAQAVLGDLLDVARDLVLRRGAGPGAAAPSPRAPAGPSAPGAARPEPSRLPLDEVRTKYYLRLVVDDRPGVLAEVAERLGGRRVSVAQMFQDTGVRGEASIVMLTHEARDRDVRDAVRGIAELRSVRMPPRAVRIFDL